MYLENIFDIFKTDQHDLKQGKQYSIFQDVLPFLKPEIQGEQFDSITEHMTNLHDISLGELCNESSELYNLEMCYQRTLQKYNSLHKIFVDDLMKQGEIRSANKNLLNTIVQDSDNNYFYVNNYGYTNKYSNINDLCNNSISCPTEIKPFGGDIADFEEGPTMNSGQACNVAGRMIQNIDTYEYAYVDVKGYKHIFSLELWNDRPSNCNGSLVELNDAEYNALPTGSPMEEASTCDNLNANLNPTNIQQMVELNNKLLDLSEKMVIEIDTLKPESEKQKIEIENKRGQLLKQYDTAMKNKKKAYTNSVGNFHTYQANSEETTYLVNSSFYQYFIWIAISLIVVYFAYQNFITSNNQEVNTSTLLVVVILILFFLILISKKVKNFLNPNDE